MGPWGGLRLDRDARFILALSRGCSPLLGGWASPHSSGPEEWGLMGSWPYCGGTQEDGTVNKG